MAKAISHRERIAFVETESMFIILLTVHVSITGKLHIMQQITIIKHDFVAFISLKYCIICFFHLNRVDFQIHGI